MKTDNLRRVQPPAPSIFLSFSAKNTQHTSEIISEMTFNPKTDHNMKSNLSPSPELLRTCHKLQMGLQDFRRLGYVDYSPYGATHGQSRHTQPLPPPPHGLNMFPGLPKAQLPCFRCTCMHVGYYRPILFVFVFVCMCVCVCVHAIGAHSIYGTGA